MNERERRAAAFRERSAAESRKISVETNFAEYALITYPRPNADADRFADMAAGAELEMRYWQGAIDALTENLPIDIEADDDAE